MIALVLIGATLCVPVLVYSYKRIRPLFSAKVKCWFCGAQTVVPYGNINCWDCPSCDQYNGFKEDGDYNKPIPAQFDEALNFMTTTSCEPDSSPIALKPKFDSRLCSVCNYHQLIKVRLLANFTPTEESQFETEVEQYRAHLEEVYALCLACETQVKRTLNLQDSLLRPQLMGHRLPTRWRVLAHYSLPWKQRLRLLLSTTASVLSLCTSVMLIMALLKNDFVLAHYGTKLGLANMVVSMPPTHLLRPAGLVLSASSVLLAGRRRLGLTALVLCFLWLQFVASHHFEVGRWLNTFYIAWSQLALACATFVLAVAHTLFLIKIQLRSGALRKLVGSSASSLSSSSPCASSGVSLSSADYLPSWDEGSQHIGQSDFADRRSTYSRQTKSSRRSARLTDLSDRMSDVHISPESERSWTTSTWSKPTSLQAASNGAGQVGGTSECGMPDGSTSSLLWPPKLRLHQGSSWMAGSMWALGGTRTPSDTQVLWGVRQRFGQLTPPPSVAGSAKHSSSSSNAGQKRQTDWVFFKQRDAFFSSSPDGRFISDMRMPASAASPSSDYNRPFNSQQSAASAPRMNGTSTLRQRTSRGAMSRPDRNAQNGSYARSSVSQTSLATGKPADTRPAADSSKKFAKWPLPKLSWLLLGLSMTLNISLFAYYFASSQMTVVRQ